MYYVDPLYIIFALPALILAVIAQIVVSYYMFKYSRIPNKRGISGEQTIRILTNNENLPIGVGKAGFLFGDSYNPITNQIYISPKNLYSDSISAVATVAHELGHAQQKEEGNLLFVARTALVPFVNIGSMLGYMLFALGLALQFFSLAWVGIILFSGTTMLSILTVPIEFDASRRGLEMLTRNNILDSEEIKHAKKMLISAGFTYIAATVQSLLNLLYFIARLSRYTDRD